MLYYVVTKLTVVIPLFKVIWTNNTLYIMSCINHPGVRVLLPEHAVVIGWGWGWVG